MFTAALPVTCSSIAAMMSRLVSRKLGSLPSAVASVQFMRGARSSVVMASVAAFTLSVPAAYSSSPETPISCASASVTETPT